MTVGHEQETVQRAMRLRGIMSQSIRSMTSEECDRRMQIHLAQARGPTGNAFLVRESTSMMLRLKAAREATPRKIADHPFNDVVHAVVDNLESAGFAYAIAGAVATGIYGEPLSVRDVDFAVRMNIAQVCQVAKSMSAPFRCRPDAAEDIVYGAGAVNLVDTDTRLKVRLRMLPSGGLFDSVFARRVMQKYGPDGPSFYTVTAEDIILMKLLWRKDTGSIKQWENALSVARVQGARMDWRYLFEQARSLGLEDDLIKLRDEAGT